MRFLPKYFLLFVSMCILIPEYAFADMILPAIVYQFLGAGFGPSAFPIALAILFIEAYFIKRLLTVRNIPAFIVSFWVNLISSAVGLVVLWTFFAKGMFGWDNMKLGVYIGMIPGYILTVMFECMLLIIAGLILRKKLSIEASLKISLEMNFYSYALLTVTVLVADLVTKGRFFDFH